MTATSFVLPRQVKTNVTGIPYAGAQAFFYQTGTQTPQSVYQDSGLTIPHDFPVVANDDGYWPVIWLDSSAPADYQVRILSANGVELDNIPNISRGLTQTDLISILGGIFKRTDVEIADGVTPADLAYAPGNPWRYGADGTGGATDIAALATASTVVAAPGVNGWRNGVPAGFLLRSAAEVAAGILPTNYNYPPLHVSRYGYSADNQSGSATANRLALNVAIAVATATISGATGATVTLPTGIGYIDQVIILPNRVRIQGANCSGSIIKATAGFTTPTPAWSGGTAYGLGNLVLSGGNTYSCILAHTNHVPPDATYWAPWPQVMFWANNGVTAMFDSILQDLFIDCSAVGGLGGILTDAWQENCGMRSVTVFNFTTIGLQFRFGFGGASTCEIAQTQFFPANVPGITACIRCDQISSVGAFLVHVRDSGLAGFAGNPVARGIDIQNDSLLLENCHFEGCVDAVRVNGVGSITLQNVSGLAGMTNILHILNTFTGRVNMQGCMRNGATNLIQNEASGETYTSPDLATYVYPEVRAANTCKAWGTFDGTTTGTHAVSGGFNTTNVQRTGAGRYTVTMTNPLLNSNYAPIANSNLSTAAKVEWTSVIGATTFTININVAGVATDASEIHFVVFGS